MSISSVRGGAAWACTAALLAACSGSQPPIGAPGAMAPSTALAQKSSVRNAGRTKTVAEFAYVANLYSNSVSAYAINASNGALTQVQGSPFAAGYGAYAVAIDPTGKFAYVANNGTSSGKQGNVSAFGIDPHTGALVPVPGSPFAAGSNPLRVTISPDSKFVYVINYNSRNISIFSIDPRTGVLKQVKTSPHGTRPFPTAEAIDPTGKFVYVTHVGFGDPYDHSGHITGYAIGMRGGALRKARGTSKETDDYPVSAAIDTSGNFLYVPNYASQAVSAYTITASTGALSDVQGSPFHTGYNPGAVAVDPNGSFVYVPFDLGIDVYKIAPSGALTPVPGSPFQGGYEPDGVAVDPLGKFVYVSNTGEYGKVSAYAINSSSGALTQVPGSPFAAGQNPAGIATCEIKNDRCVPSPL